MNLTNEERKAIIEYRYEKSDKALKEAEDLARLGHCCNNMTPITNTSKSRCATMSYDIGHFTLQNTPYCMAKLALLPCNIALLTKHLNMDEIGIHRS